MGEIQNGITIIVPDEIETYKSAHCKLQICTNDAQHIKYYPTIIMIIIIIIIFSYTL